MKRLGLYSAPVYPSKTTAIVHPKAEPVFTAEIALGQRAERTFGPIRQHRFDRRPDERAGSLWLNRVIRHHFTLLQETLTMTTRSSFNLRWLLVPLALVLGLLAFGGASRTLASQGDERINLAGYLGGDVIYCSDGNNNATSEPNGAGIRLLNMNGVELFKVSAAQINAVPEHPAVNTLIAQGNGSYGPIYLSRLTDGRFQLTGSDDHGKPYVFEWTGCTQVTPIPNGHEHEGQGTHHRFDISAYCNQFDGEDKQDCLDYWIPVLEADCKDHGYNTSAECLDWLNTPR